MVCYSMSTICLSAPWPPSWCFMLPRMARSVTRPTANRARRDAVYNQVVEAVERLLKQGESFTSLGIGRISVEAGVARSAFYKNFADKIQLLTAVTEHATRELFTASEAWIQSPEGLGTNALHATLMEAIGIFREHAAVLTAYREVASYDPEVAEFWTSRIEKLVIAMREKIASGQHAGAIRAALEPRTTAEFAVWGAERAIARHVATTPAATDQQFAHDLALAVGAMLS